MIRDEELARKGRITMISKSPVITAGLMDSVYDVVHIMAEKGFRRIPIVDSRTKNLQGIVTSTDIVDYLGGGGKFEIIQRELGGSFFKAINEPVKSIMQPNPPSVQENAAIESVIEIMKQRNVGGLPIVDRANKVIGIVTEKDLLSIFERKAKNVEVATLMTRKVVTGASDTTILEAEKEMVSKSFRRLPIVSDGRLVGIITAMDIVRFFGSGEVFQHLRSGTMLQVLQTPALQIGTKELITTSENADAAEAARTMRERNVGALLIVDGERLVGMLTERDFFKLGSRP
jgi:CBS domain-containing protein